MSGSKKPGIIEALLRKERIIIIAALTLITLGAWFYTLYGVGMPMTAFQMTPGLDSSLSVGGGNMEMSGHQSMQLQMQMPTSPWSFSYALLMLAMWWLMMVAMMLPSATPTILLAAAINRQSSARRPPFGATGAFVSGYLLAWLLFSAIAALVQSLLSDAGVLSMMASTSTHLTAGLLIAAGVWQFTPVKQACLRHCRSPISFLLAHRGKGMRGAIETGFKHGIYCLGCCWFLMALLFVGGVMNLFWIVGLAALVFIEKVVAGGQNLGRLVGIGLIAAGVLVLVS